MMTRELTAYQKDALFVVGNNEPVSVTDVAYHLNAEPGPTRSRLETLERRGLIARQYTGHYRAGSQFAYNVTDAGHAALAAIDEPTGEPGECDLCGQSNGSHLRSCVANPARNQQVSGGVG